MNHVADIFLISLTGKMTTPHLPIRQYRYNTYRATSVTSSNNASPYISSVASTLSSIDKRPAENNKMKTVHPLLKILLLFVALSNLAYAFYDPGQGRWVSRDPIQEQGGANLYGFVDNSPTTYTDTLGLAKKWMIFYTGGSGNFDRYDDPFGNGPISRAEAARSATRTASDTVRFSNGRKLTADARLQATSATGAVVRGEPYDAVTVEGSSVGSLTGYRETSRSSETVETVWLEADQSDQTIKVRIAPARQYNAGERLAFSKPTDENPVAAAGLAVVTNLSVNKRVTVSYRASAVYTHDQSAFPAHFGSYFGPHNNDFIAWLPGGYQPNYSGVDAYRSAQTPFISLTFEIKCIDVP